MRGTQHAHGCHVQFMNSLSILCRRWPDAYWDFDHGFYCAPAMLWRARLADAADQTTHCRVVETDYFPWPLRALPPYDPIAAAKAEDMNLPGYKFHRLTGERKGTCAVSVTGNWRITFRFEGEDAVDVDLEDYH